MSYEQGYAVGYEVGTVIAKILKIAFYLCAPYVVYKFIQRRKLNAFKGPEA